jgi:hypothetical protein
MAKVPSVKQRMAELERQEKEKAAAEAQAQRVDRDRSLLKNLKVVRTGKLCDRQKILIDEKLTLSIGATFAEIAAGCYLVETGLEIFEYEKTRTKEQENWAGGEGDEPAYAALAAKHRAGEEAGIRRYGALVAAYLQETHGAPVYDKSTGELLGFGDSCGVKKDSQGSVHLQKRFRPSSVTLDEFVKAGKK